MYSPATLWDFSRKNEVLNIVTTLLTARLPLFKQDSNCENLVQGSSRFPICRRHFENERSLGTILKSMLFCKIKNNFFLLVLHLSPLQQSTIFPLVASHWSLVTRSLAISRLYFALSCCRFILNFCAVVNRYGAIYVVLFFLAFMKRWTVFTSIAGYYWNGEK